MAMHPRGFTWLWFLGQWRFCHFSGNAPQWSLLLIFLITIIQSSFAFILEGSPKSYARFPKWNPGTNGSISFEFVTDQPNALLMYTDDGGRYDFFELKLIEGTLRLRLNLGGGAIILTEGRNLHDKKPHKVSVIRSKQITKLVVDNNHQQKASPGNEFLFGDFSTNSDVYFGGLPPSYINQLSNLALPSVVFEPHFRGKIQNIAYTFVQGTQISPQILESYGLRVNEHELNLCAQNDPCLNKGSCINTDSGPICDCTNTDYEGLKCELEKTLSDATFRGSEYLTYNLTKQGEAIVSSVDEISLQFKTRQPSGLLFYTGDGSDYLNLALKDSGVIVTINLGSGNVEIYIKQPKIRFDDNQWHTISVHRQLSELGKDPHYCHMSVTVDGVYTERRTIAGVFTVLSSRVVYVGGSPNTGNLPGSRIRANYEGCLRKVQFRADSLILDLISLGRQGSSLLSSYGRVEFSCQEVGAADPVTFSTSRAFLKLPKWEAPRSGSISFKLRTNEANGLLMYNNGATTVSDFFALELQDGHIYMLLNLGSGAVKVKATHRQVNDGNWHLVTLNRNGKTGRITVDESATDFTTPGDSNQLDLEGYLYIGGVGMDSVPIPKELWSGMLQHGYVGCIRDLVVDGGAVDMAAFARNQNSSGISTVCKEMPKQCDSQPCLHGGLCTEGWNRFICDCSMTGYTGATCSKDAAIVSFDGKQYVKITFPEESQTEAEDITLRFRTNRPSGLLLLTYADKSADKLELFMESGRVKLILHLGHGEKIWTAGNGLNDNQWHTVKVRRRGRNVELQVDREPAVSDEVTGDHKTLEFRYINVGAVSPGKNEGENKVFGRVPNFSGNMQQLMFNGHSFFELAHSGQMSNIEVTAKFGKKEQIVHHPFTIKSKYTFLALPQLKTYATLNLYFQFKTLEPNGLILYNAGKGQDFISVEMVNGHIHYVFNLGDGPRIVRSNTRHTLNDNNWHAVTISRPSVDQHILMVDDTVTKVTNGGNNIHLDLDGLLYVGGVMKAMYDALPKMISSRNGYQGCLASLDLNGESPDPILDATVPSDSIIKGCEGPSTRCTENVCANGGVCVQQWNSYTCDCDMTSFSGPTCSDESIAYEFGPDPGLITFTYPQDKRMDTKGDLLALGFIAHHDSAVLVRIESASSNDYMELELDNGNLFMIYSVGTADYPMGDSKLQIADGRYHIVRFTRSGPNATLQIDESPVLTNRPTGKQLTIFNDQSKIQVGGKKNPLTNRIERPFEGIITGLVFNGMRVLDLAAENDPRITVEGDVLLLMSIPYNTMGNTVSEENPSPWPDYRLGREQTPTPQMQQTTATDGGLATDDLIFSGAGSGCTGNDDEDINCILDEIGSDQLVTPVYKPTRAPVKGIFPTLSGATSAPYPVHPIPETGREGSGCDDEEDCIGSGSGDRELAPTPPDDFFLYSSPDGVSPDTNPDNMGSTKNPLTVDELVTEQPGKGSNNVDSATNTFLIIGIIAAILVLLIVVAFVIYKYRIRNEGSYKVDESKNYQFTSGAPPSTPVNGNIKTNDKAGKLPKKKDLKDIKEWYV